MNGMSKCKKCPLAFIIIFIILNMLLVTDIIIAGIYKRTVVGASNMILYSGIIYVIFSAFQLCALLFVGNFGKYLFACFLSVPKIAFMVFIEIALDFLIRHSSDYKRDAFELVIIICFFVLTALLFLAEISYCIINLVGQLKKESKGENSSV